MKRVPRGSRACRRLRRHLQRYLDGETTVRRTRQIAAHLEGCAPCAEKAAMYDLVRAAFAVLVESGEHEAAVARLRAFADLVPLLESGL